MSGVSPGESGATPWESGATPAESGASPGVSGATPAESGASPGVSGATPAESGASPGVSGATPAESGASPGVSGATPAESGASPGVSGASPGVSGATPPPPPCLFRGCGPIRHRPLCICCKLHPRNTPFAEGRGHRLVIVAKRPWGPLCLQGVGGAVLPRRLSLDWGFGWKPSKLFWFGYKFQEYGGGDGVKGGGGGALCRLCTWHAVDSLTVMPR